MQKFLIAALALAVFGVGIATADDHEDPYLWLEEGSISAGCGVT